MIQSPMDDVDLKCYGNRKRKRESRKRKLLVNERVEVMSLEEGFLGSWHPATVTRCGRLKRHVKYDNILDDKGLDYVVDVVNVSSVLDGVSVTSSSDSCSNERGLIRPLPPPFGLEEKDLKFGLCVDVHYQEAWWEGVVFDNCDGMEERRVFFPDLGDEMKIATHQLRRTHDWDEASEIWKPRGKWMLLELIEECERGSFITVSVQQIWYDVRASKDFDNIRDWTCKNKDLWRNIVMEIVGDYYTLTEEETLPALNLPKDFMKEAQVIGSHSLVENGDMPNLVDSDKKCGSVIAIEEEYDKELLADEASKMGIISQEQVEPVSAAQEDASFCEKKRKRRHSKSIPGHPMIITEVEYCSDVIAIEEEYDKDLLVDEASKMGIISQEQVEPISAVQEDAGFCEKKRKRRHSKSIPWHPMIITEVEYCSDVIEQYLLGCGSKTIRELLKGKVWKHLAYLGWKIEWTEDSNFLGRRRYRYKSPDTQDFKVYTSLIQVVTHMSSMKSVLLQINDSNKMHLTKEKNLSNLSDQPQNDWDQDVYPPKEAPSLVKSVIEPEFCHEAVVKYYLHALENHGDEKKKWKLKAMKHLLAEGWSFDYPTKNRRTILYKSPENLCLGTLQGACRLYIKERIPEWTTSGIAPLNEENVDNDNLLQSLSQLLQKEPELNTVDVSLAIEPTEGRRNHKRERKSKRHGKGAPTRVLRSSKRVQEVCAPSLSHQMPQNVLSWLIDNKMVMPRCKVFYRGKGGGNVVEGRITCDGIKCCCCQEVYGLGGFVNHASGSSSDCRPSASIYLRDGRSLLDCIVQIMHDHRARESAENPCNDLCDGENDNVCSVCQYGGVLMISLMVTGFVHHVAAGFAAKLKLKGRSMAFFLPAFNVNINVYAGLQSLLGKPIVVGANNLTWTLVKYINSGVGSVKDELLAENYSKLSVALSVMHECFEPFKNPVSNRDIIDDVIYNSRSELNRLNFQGFYTVLLERNEEMISAATIRIFGQKIAEVPLVGTRLQYRRLGMCRILMDELEKKLMQLGVERLVLPAVPGVLETWTNSFGFSEMTNFERSQFLDYAFLEFQGTVMCQKLLTKIPSSDSVVTKETHPKPCEGFSVKCRIDFGKSSPVSEVDQAEEVDKSRVMDMQVEEYV
ncbi:hypothetical protein RJT34_11781 [Clitoria ternatea]|uniref:N-acetyltransferase domain-containing protein n=1 Tax=Clitoria ternatea TaxID=43366 RepID=A0AAN9JN89_CLITE